MEHTGKHKLMREPLASGKALGLQAPPKCSMSEMLTALSTVYPERWWMTSAVRCNGVCQHEHPISSVENII